VLIFETYGLDHEVRSNLIDDKKTKRTSNKKILRDKIEKKI
jgi:hypothetical protein